MTTAPRRVLVVRLDKVGDLVLSTPALRNIRDAWPAAHVTVLVSPENADVLRSWPAVDDLRLYDPRWSVVRKWRALRRLRRPGFDVALVLSPALDGFAAAWMSGATLRAGVVYSRRVTARLLAPWLTPERTIVRIDEALARGDEIPHEVDQSLAALRPIGLSPRRVPLELAVDPHDRDWARAVISRVLPRRPVAVLHLSNLWFAGGGRGHEMRTLLDALIADGPLRSVLVTHGPADAGAAHALCHEWRLEPVPIGGDVTVLRDPGARVAVVGGLSVGRWAALIDAADMVLTRDTGALHVAAACGTPVVAIYESATFTHCAAQWAPWMVPHRVLCAAPWPILTRTIANAARELHGSREPKATPAGAM